MIDNAVWLDDLRVPPADRREAERCPLPKQRASSKPGAAPIFA
jgi:hypothetical protein